MADGREPPQYLSEGPFELLIRLDELILSKILVR